MTTDRQIEDVNVRSVEVLITPDMLKTQMPLSEQARQTVLTGRQTIRNILDGKDPRLFVVLGLALFMM